MLRIVFVLAVLLTGCDDVDTEASRKVVSVTSPAGHAFNFMPIYEKGVSDITFRIAWPNRWTRGDDRNPAVPLVGADLILSGGTKDMKPQQIIAFFEEKNARGFLSAGPDYVFGELEAPKEHIDETVKVAAEMLATPQFDEAWLGRIKQGALARQKETNALSSTQLYASARLSILGDTPLYASLTLPDADIIGTVTREDVLAWHAETFGNNGLEIAVTGAVSPQDAGRLVDKILAGLPELPAPPQIEDASNFAAKTVLLHLPEAEKTSIGLLGQLPSTFESGDHLDYLAVSLMNGSSGPLFDALRTELRATYGVEAGYANYTRALRVFFIQGEVDTAQLGEARDVSLKAYEAFRTEPDFTGLDELKTSVANGTEEHISYVNISARVIMELALDDMDPSGITALPDLYRNATEDELRARLLQSFPGAEELMVFAVSPDREAMPGACVITRIEEVLDCP